MTDVVVEVGLTGVRVGRAGGTAPMAASQLSFPSRELEAEEGGTFSADRFADEIADAAARVIAAHISALAGSSSASSTSSSAIAQPPKQAPFRVVLAVPSLGLLAPPSKSLREHQTGARVGPAQLETALARRLMATTAAAQEAALRPSKDDESTNEQSGTSGAKKQKLSLVDVRVVSSEACAAGALVLLERGGDLESRGGSGEGEGDGRFALTESNTEGERISALGQSGGAALLVDVGAVEARALPVVHATPVPALAASVPLHAAQVGGLVLRDSLLQRLDVQVAGGRIFGEGADADVFQVWEEVASDLVERACFCAGSSGSGDPGPDLEYPLPTELHASFAGADLSLPWDLRWRLVDEVLFRGTGDPDGRTLVHVVLDALIEAPLDTRASLARNIVLCGGMARLPGLGPRLLISLREVLSPPPNEESAELTHTAMDPYDRRNYATRLGGLRDILGVSSCGDPSSAPTAVRRTVLQAPHLSWLGASLFASLDEFWASSTGAGVLC